MLPNDTTALARLRARFDAKWTLDPETGCHVWTAHTNARGYGRFGVGSARVELAHRVAWVLAHGPIPDGLMVCHDCDNPPCVNDAHHFLGTNAANCADMAKKRRSTHGERNARARLTADQVAEIRALHVPGARNQHAIATRFGVSDGTVSMIVHRKIWTDVD